MRRRSRAFLVVALSAAACATEMANAPPVGPAIAAQVQSLDKAQYLNNPGRFLEAANSVAAGAYGQQRKPVDVICAPESAWQTCKHRGAGEYLCGPEQQRAKAGAQDVVAMLKVQVDGLRGASADARAQEAFSQLFQRYDDLLKPIEEAYGRFQSHRFLLSQSQLQYDEGMQETTVQMGLAAMYAIRQLLDFHEGMTALKCSVKPFEPAVAGARGLFEDLRGQLSGLLRQLEKSVDPLGFALFQVEFGVLAGEDITKKCEEVVDRLAGGDVAYDGPIAAWCGYAFHLVGDTTRARKYYELAAHSAHSPEATNYGLAGTRAVQRQVGTAKLRRLEGAEDE